jgi:asparagine synthase (glutamine-hydrolysing)
MCGISGIAGNIGEDKRLAVIRRMNDCMSHRGPDADGVYADKHIALGHRRLSIIDLSTSANQPFKDNSGRYILVFNGEIYNFQEIKPLLKEYDFKTNGDTEVIMAAYIKWGPSCLQHFKGMFSIVIWDTAEKKLFAARDRFGVKPFYYYDNDGLFLFGSEIRSILASNLVKPALNEQSLYDYLMFQSVVSPSTLVMDVKQLPAGHYLDWKEGMSELKRYWNVSGNIHEIREQSYDQVKSKVRDLLYKSVERRLVSDVPLGTFLSGGVDSSIIAGIMAEVNPQQTNAFTIAFDEEQYDESEYAALIARKFNLNHTKVLLRPSDFLEQLPTALDSMDTPSGDGLNTYVVSKAIRNSGIVVAMSGLGGDELFAGYDIFKHFLKLRKYKQLLPISHKFNSLGGLLPAGNKFFWQLKKILQFRSANINELYPVFRQILSATDIKRLTNLNFSKGYSGQIQLALNGSFASIKEYNLLSQVSIAEYLGYTQHVLLKDTDQMSMASSLEVREPFFDHDLVEYVLNVPDKYKSGKFSKSLLVEATYPILPDEIITRKKQGFVLPYDHWIRNELRSFCQQKINDLSARPLFNAKAVQKFWQGYLNNKGNLRWADIWILIVLENWLQKNNVQ